MSKLPELIEVSWDLHHLKSAVIRFNSLKTTISVEKRLHLPGAYFSRIQLNSEVRFRFAMDSHLQELK